MKRLILCLFCLAVLATADERSLENILRDGNNAFTARMFTEVVKENPSQSVVLSAFSVLTPLAQIALASVGESHDELLATIGMPNDNITKAVFAGVNTHLRSVKGVTLKAASKIYIAKNYEINSDFAVLTRDAFGSEVANVDFVEDEKTAKEINLWVEEQTNNRIKDLVDPASLDEYTIALLVNAIYFKGLWEIPFGKDSTLDRDFHVSKDNTVKVPTMYNKDNYRYIDSQQLNAQTKAVFAGVNTHLRSVKGVTLKAASKIYIAKNYEINSDFAVLTRDAFGSEVANVDFVEDEKTAKEINLWVEEQTNNRIKDLVDPASLDEYTIALLVNAIYFKGLWEIPFGKDSTLDRDFHVSKDNTVKVPTMYNKDNYRYIDSQQLNAQVLELKYKGGESALYVVLPHEVDGISKLEEKLTDPSLLDNVIEDMFETEVEVFLPKFKIETTTDLKKVLENMNVKKLFNAQTARLDNLLKAVSSGLYISDAKQKAFIEVNEEGAEAAAANYFIDVIYSAGNYEIPPTIFIADRPFYFIVKEKSLSLFNGIYTGN